MEIDWKEIASCILFGDCKYSINDMIDKYNIEYRKNKNISDLKNAIKKAHKNGNLKTEFEIDMLSLYLSQTFKVRRNN